MTDQPLRVLPPESGDVAQRELADEEILDGLHRGDPWAAEALYDRLAPVVERTLHRVLQSRDDRFDDLVQSTFERVVRTIGERRFAGACSLTTWASAIAGHVGIDAIRQRVRERRLFREAPAPADGSPSEPPGDRLHELASDGRRQERQLEARSDVERLQAILSRMKPDQARAVVLHDVLGHDLSEIAVITGVSVAAAQSRLVRGRKELLRRAGATVAAGEGSGDE